MWLLVKVVGPVSWSRTNTEPTSLGQGLKYPGDWLVEMWPFFLKHLSGQSTVLPYDWNIAQGRHVPNTEHENNIIYSLSFLLLTFCYSLSFYFSVYPVTYILILSFVLLCSSVLFRILWSLIVKTGARSIDVTSFVIDNFSCCIKLL